MCTACLDRSLFYYAEWHEAYRIAFKLNGLFIVFREGLPEVADYFLDNEKKQLPILDDLMREFSNVILDLFTKGSHD